METDSYSANQRRAINLVWTACGDYQFEPQFLALKADGTPDFYMNCVIGLVRKWLGDEMPRRLFALWADDTRRSAFDDLAWLALENAVYEKELPVRPVLTELRRAHAAEFFASEYQLSRQEWMDKNQLVYSLQSARWRSVLGQKPPLLAPWEKGLSEALACPGTLDADDLEAAVRAAEGGDEDAKKLLIEHNLRLVVYISKRFENTGINIEDLISIGTIGLIKAVNTFNSSKNIKLATYASRCIENEILMYLRKINAQRTEISFDEPLNTDWDGNELLLSDILGTDEDEVARPLEDDADKQMLMEAIDTLNEREKRIILMRFGLPDGREYTQKEVADIMGISQSYISRLEKRIIGHLRKEMLRLLQV